MNAHFEALDKGVLIAAFKSTGYFFPILISLEVRCGEYLSHFMAQESVSPRLVHFHSDYVLPKNNDCMRWCPIATSGYNDDEKDLTFFGKKTEDYLGRCSL